MPSLVLLPSGLTWIWVPQVPRVGAWEQRFSKRGIHTFRDLSRFAPFLRPNHMQPMLVLSRAGLVCRFACGQLSLVLALDTPPQCVHKIDHLAPRRRLLFKRQRK